jgi:outer membrane protein assembly factor BamB
MGAIANGATPGKCFSSDVESGLWEVCQIRNNEPSSARTLLLTAEEVAGLLDSGGYLGSCIESDDLSGDADSRTEINSALLEDRDSGFWLENAVPQSTTPMNFDAADPDGDCMVPLDLATWEDHPEYFSASSAQEVESIIQFTHGWTLSDIAGDGLLSPHFDPETVANYDRDSTNYLGDFFHTTLAVEVPPSHLVRGTQGYTAFVNAHWDRRSVIFAGSNDGQVYCFDADTGELLWSYVPGSFLPQLGLTMYSRRPMIDGPLVLSDLICGQTDEGLPEYCTVLSINYGAGGSGMTLLDVTDPEKPRFLMEITGRDVPELGLSTAAPLLTNAYIEDASGVTAQVQGIVVLPGGYPAGGIEALVDGNLIGYSAGEVLLVTDLEGAILRQFDPINESEIFRTCGAVTGSPAGWSPDITRTVYVTTQYGCLLRLDISSAAPMDWTLNLHDQATNPGMGILKPAIATNSDGSLTIIYTQGSAEFEPHLNRITSLVSVQENLTLSDASFGNPSVYTVDSVNLNEREHVNYELVFQPGESVTAAPFIANGTVYFATWAPNSSEACDLGSARLWGIDYVGNSNIDGPESDRSYLVDSSSERLIPMWPNPDLSISDNPMVPYLTDAQLFTV